MADLELTREEKERFLKKTSDVLFAGVLNKLDIVAILEIYSMACRRETAKLDEELRKEIGPVSDVIQ